MGGENYHSSVVEHARKHHAWEEISRVPEQPWLEENSASKQQTKLTAKEENVR